jgi:hypothetical protein
MKKIFKQILLGVLAVFLIFISFFFIGTPPQAQEIKWGVNFSQKHAKDLGLDWKETYLALLDDLKVKNIKLITQWDLIEPEQGRYDFKDLDWQVEKAEEKGAKVILVIGMKTGRWPECHIPDWAKNLSEEKQQGKILKLIENIVLRYKDSETIGAWQIENEPLFPFGECPWKDKKFLKKETELVKSFDSNTNGALPCEQLNSCVLSSAGVDYKKRPIIISDSGEMSFWIEAARLSDVIGITMYKKIWFQQLSHYISYPFPSTFYWRKAQIIKKLFNKKVIVVELQAEPWGQTLLYNSPLKEQEKTMNLQQFQENIEFAKKTGFDEFYLWGSEWWYWLKENQNNSEIWKEAKKLWL